MCFIKTIYLCGIRDDESPDTLNSEMSLLAFILEESVVSKLCGWKG